MRIYFGSTAAELKDFISDGEIEIPELYAATPQFKSTHSDCDEEELEFILSLLAADDALDFSQEDSSTPVVIACEVGDDSIDSYGEMFVTLKGPVLWSTAEAVFTVGEDAEDLTWFAAEEVPLIIDSWS